MGRKHDKGWIREPPDQANGSHELPQNCQCDRLVDPQTGVECDVPPLCLSYCKHELQNKVSRPGLSKHKQRQGILPTDPQRSNVSEKPLANLTTLIHNQTAHLPCHGAQPVASSALHSPLPETTHSPAIPAWTRNSGFCSSTRANNQMKRKCHTSKHNFVDISCEDCAPDLLSKPMQGSFQACHEVRGHNGDSGGPSPSNQRTALKHDTERHLCALGT
jgi:hypothetical protein